MAPDGQMGAYKCDRTGAWAFFWGCLVIAAIGVVAGIFIHPFGFAGTLLVFAALWYYLAIRWVDKHDRWS